MGDNGVQHSACYRKNNIHSFLNNLWLNLVIKLDSMKNIIVSFHAQLCRFMLNCATLADQGMYDNVRHVTRDTVHSVENCAENCRLFHRYLECVTPKQNGEYVSRQSDLENIVDGL